MALAVNARTAVGTAVPAHAVAGISSFKQATSVRFSYGKPIHFTAINKQVIDTFTFHRLG